MDSGKGTLQSGQEKLVSNPHTLINLLHCISQISKCVSSCKMVGAGVVAVWHWSGQEEIPDIQGQRRSPSKMVGGAKSRLETNHIPATDAQRAQTKPCAHQKTPQRPSQICLCVFECLLRRYGSAVDCHRDRVSECSRPGYGISPLGGGYH